MLYASQDRRRGISRLGAFPRRRELTLPRAFEARDSQRCQPFVRRLAAPAEASAARCAFFSPLPAACKSCSGQLLSSISYTILQYDECYIT